MPTEGKRSPTSHRTPAQLRAHGKGFQAKPGERKRRAKRNTARAIMKKKVGKAALKGKDVDHKKMLSKGGGNGTRNLRVQSVKKNRGRTR